MRIRERRFTIMPPLVFSVIFLQELILPQSLDNEARGSKHCLLGLWALYPPLEHLPYQLRAISCRPESIQSLIEGLLVLDGGVIFEECLIVDQIFLG